MNKSIFTKEDINEIITMIKKRLDGEITYEELEAYRKVIQKAVDESQTGRRPVAHA